MGASVLQSQAPDPAACPENTSGTGHWRPPLSLLPLLPAPSDLILLHLLSLLIGRVPTPSLCIFALLVVDLKNSMGLSTGEFRFCA